jgi:predicted RNase H-related nuclease YkuK (DUF458 family)
MKLNGIPVFRDHTGKVVEDIKPFVRHWLREYPGGKIFVGCDSKKRGNTVKYATVVCLWNVGHGVREIYRNELIPAPNDRFTRLWNEVTRAVDVANELRSIAPIQVHVDINSNPKFKSNQLYDASIGFINSMGFEGAGKPFSWAASCGAHKHCQ